MAKLYAKEDFSNWHHADDSGCYQLSSSEEEGEEGREDEGEDEGEEEWEEEVGESVGGNGKCNENGDLHDSGIKMEVGDELIDPSLRNI